MAIYEEIVDIDVKVVSILEISSTDHVLGEHLSELFRLCVRSLFIALEIQLKDKSINSSHFMGEIKVLPES